MVFVVDLVIDPGNAVIAISKFCDWTEKVMQRCWEIRDRPRTRCRPKATGCVGAARGDLSSGKLLGEIAKSIAGGKTYRNAMTGQNLARLGDPSCRGLRGHARKADDK